MPTPSRQQFLDAGAAFARRLPQLTAGALTRAAGLGTAALRGEFGSFEAFRVALMFFWIDQIRSAVVEALAPARGPERLLRAVEAYLDANLERPGMRMLMRELRGDPQIGERVQERIRGFTVVLQLELRELGWLRHETAGRLYAAMAVEVAQAEFEAGARLPELRETLRVALVRP